MAIEGRDKDRREIEAIDERAGAGDGQVFGDCLRCAWIDCYKDRGRFYSAPLNGNVTLHGVTNQQPVTAQVAVFGNKLRASGEFTLHQTDYQIS